MDPGVINDFDDFDDLSPTVEYIIFGDYFNQSIEPLKKFHNIKKLEFGWDFNQSIEPLRYLIKLETLTFGDAFNQTIEPLENLIQLKYIFFGNDFDKSINPLRNLPNLTFISIDIFRWHKFTYPIGCPTIRIRHTDIRKSYEEDYDSGKYDSFLTNLFKTYSEYIKVERLAVLGGSTYFPVGVIQLNDKTCIRIIDQNFEWFIEFVSLNGNGNYYYKDLQDITIEDIDEFLGLGSEMKPAKG